MGLDMYLIRKTYAKNWDHREKRHKITKRNLGKELKHINPEKINYIEEEVGYWRKANAIHSWFVKNIQNGVDDCGEYRVELNDLIKLKKACNTILSSIEVKHGVIQNGASMKAGESEMTPNFEVGKMIMNEDICEELLPTQSGFFFGSTNYDEWYINDLKDTIQVIENLEKDTWAADSGEKYLKGDVYYLSSW